MNTSCPPTQPTPTEIEDLRQRIAHESLASLHLIEEIVTRRSLEPTTTTRGLLEIAEHKRKIVDMLIPKEVSVGGNGVSIVFNIPSFNGQPAQTVQVARGAAPPEMDFLVSDGAMLGPPPAYTLAYDGDLFASGFDEAAV